MKENPEKAKEQSLKFAVIGCGFWSHFQIAAWQELEGVELVAVCDVDEKKARAMAQKFKIEDAYYGSAQTLFENEMLDFVDIITDPDTHVALVQLAAHHRVDVICQKPMAPSLQAAEDMVAICRRQKIKFFIHENFRWQAPIRRLKSIIDSGVIGQPFKGRIMFCSGFPVFENQPFLAELEQFILADVGTHVLDVARFLFGEMRSLTALTQTINPGIKGEDVANVLMDSRQGVHCYVEMSYASILEDESFPETRILVEGSEGSAYLDKHYEIRVTRANDSIREFATPKGYSWADQDYAVVHASIVDTNRDLLQGLKGLASPETTADDNLETLRLVFASYDSAREGRTIPIHKSGGYG